MMIETTMINIPDAVSLTTIMNNAATLLMSTAVITKTSAVPSNSMQDTAVMISKALT